jgi:hypothetical protein
MQATQQADLFEPGEYLRGAGRPGYFSVLTKRDGWAYPASFELAHLPAVVESLNPALDSYITQAVFARRNRCIMNLRDVGLLFVDLDTYRTPGLAGKSAEELTALLLLYCGQEGLPAPSIILYSGRGLQAKWLLSEALEPVSLCEWNQAQLALVRLLEPFAADMNSKDVTRVLRVDRTVNTKSGERCRVVYVTGGIEACPARYDFADLRALLVGQEEAQAPRERRRQAADRPALALPAELNFKRLNWYRLYDLRDLWRLRGGVREGWRELTLFWELNFLLRAEPGRVADLWKEAEVLAAEIDPGWFGEEIRRSTFSTLYRKAQEARAGVSFEYAGRTYPPLYTPRNTTLLELFRIDPQEERNLRTIISREEKYRRLVESRRAAGAKPRVEYEELALSNTRPWEALGVSRATWYRVLRP